MKTLLSLSAFALVISCSQPANQSSIDKLATTDSATLVMQPSRAKSIEDYFQQAGDSVILPSFSIELKLSSAAEEKLKQLNETVIVSASFDGKPKDTTNSFYKKWGYIVIDNSQMELKESRTATFSSVKISKAAYDSLANKDIEVLIDVFSGRHSSQNNLLSCESIQAPISKVQRRKNMLHGKLIGE